MAHTIELADAKDLLRAGLDGFAHMVRDKDVDEEFLALVKERPNVFFLETLWGERRAIYTGKPAWLDDPSLREAFSADDLKQLDEQLRREPNANPQAVQRARTMAETNLRNTAKLYAAGVRIGLGTDTGGVSGGQFFGLGSHIELELLVTRVGLTPMQALVVGTKTSAENLGLADLGTLARRQERRFHRARRQSARQHRQHAAHQQGLSARPGNSPRRAVGQMERQGVRRRAARLSPASSCMRRTKYS